MVLQSAYELPERLGLYWRHHVLYEVDPRAHKHKQRHHSDQTGAVDDRVVVFLADENKELVVSLIIFV